MRIISHIDRTTRLYVINNCTDDALPITATSASGKLFKHIWRAGKGEADGWFFDDAGLVELKIDGAQTFALDVPNGARIHIIDEKKLAEVKANLGDLEVI